MARPASDYRGARRNRARAAKLVWRALPRVRWSTGMIVVMLPEQLDRLARKAA